MLSRPIWSTRTALGFLLEKVPYYSGCFKLIHNLAGSVIAYRIDAL